MWGCAAIRSRGDTRSSYQPARGVSSAARTRDISAGAPRENLASRRVLEKLGMRRTPNAYFDTRGGVYYSIARADWRPTNDAYMIRTD